jgi:hypothetical protein
LRATCSTTCAPDDGDTDDEHLYEWLAALCRQHGLDATGDDLRRRPYFVEPSDQVRRRLIPGRQRVTDAAVARWAA